MIEALMLASMVSTTILVTDNSSQGKSAVTHIVLATYRYTELDKQIEPTIKNIEKRYVPETLRNMGISSYFMYRLVTDKRVEYTWSF